MGDRGVTSARSFWQGLRVTKRRVERSGDSSHSCQILTCEMEDAFRMFLKRAVLVGEVLCAKRVMRRVAMWLASVPF